MHFENFTFFDRKIYKKYGKIVRVNRFGYSTGSSQSNYGKIQISTIA